MSLIFAVDSDKRQSAVLASLLHSHVNADLVQSGSATEGLDILQGRIPDLILTSSLLSPRDEAALANHLRELGDGAAHVHTLTIPVIATSSQGSRKKPQGMLGSLRREKDSRPSGCDPTVFAREVALYLDRAVERRTHAGGAVVHVAFIDAVPVSSPELETAPEVVECEAPTSASVSDESDDSAAPALPLDQLLRLVGRDDPRRDEVAAPMWPSLADAAETAGLSARELAELSAPIPEGRLPDAVLAPEAPVPTVDMGTCEDLDLLEDRFAVSIDADALEALDTTSTGSLPNDVWPAPVPDLPDPAWPWVDDQTSTPLAEVLFDACTPMMALDPEPEPQLAPPLLDLEALELIGAAAHRAGLEAFDTLPEPTVAPQPPDAPADKTESPPAFRRTRERSVKVERKAPQKAPRPAQDEWGMYDPAQCGPAALFDEEEWDEDPAPPRPVTRTRDVVY